jgi:hypothetical protein
MTIAILYISIRQWDASASMSSVLSADAKRPVVWGPNMVSISCNTEGYSRQSSLSRGRLSLSAHVLAET